MRKTYFIDSENVGDNWISLIDTIAPKDELIVFFTQKSPHMNYKNVILLKQSDKKITFIECYEGTNALDFQLCKELGYRMHELTEEEFIVISNDTEFDAIVKYWSRQNKLIKRITSKSCTITEPTHLTPSNKNIDIPLVSCDNLIPLENTEICTTGVDENAKELLFLIGKNNLQDLYECLKQLYGTKRGTTIYNAFKLETAFNKFLTRHKKMNTTEKQLTYCSIVFSMMAPTEPIPKDFPPYLIES